MEYAIEAAVTVLAGALMMHRSAKFDTSGVFAGWFGTAAVLAAVTLMAAVAVVGVNAIFELAD
jgi:hypothetical protein